MHERRHDTPDKSSDTRPKTNTKRLALLASTVFISGLAGEYFLADTLKTIGDPSGKGISFGLGGLLGVIMFFILRNCPIPGSRADATGRE